MCCAKVAKLFLQAESVGDNINVINVLFQTVKGRGRQKAGNMTVTQTNISDLFEDAEHVIQLSIQVKGVIHNDIWKRCILKLF